MAETRWLDQDEQRMWRHWTRLNLELTSALQRDLQDDAGLSVPDFQVLAVLSESPGDEMRISELALSLQWEQSRLSHHLKRMAARDLLERVACAEDGRGWFARLTPHGRATVERAAPGHASSVRRLFLDSLEPGEVHQLEAILERVRAGLASQRP